MIRTNSDTTEHQENGLVPGIFGFPLVFWHPLYASCFNTTIEEYGDKRAKGTKALCNYSIRDILDCVHLGVDSVDSFFPVVELAAAILGHPKGMGGGTK